MTDQIEEIAEDSTGATEADEALDNSIIEGDEDEASATEGDESDLPEEVYYEIDGEEVSAADIQKWKSGHMKDADYTKKTQALAEERKAFSKSKSDLDTRLTELDALQSEIEKAILGDLSEVDLEQILNEKGSEEYLKVQSQIERRKKEYSALTDKYNKLKQSQIAESQKALSDALGWSDPSKYEQDVKAITGYVKDVGITDAEFSKVTSPKVMEAILKASKYDKLMQSKPDVMKRVTKAPKTTKPKATTTNRVLKPWEEVYGVN